MVESDAGLCLLLQHSSLVLLKKDLSVYAEMAASELEIR